MRNQRMRLAAAMMVVWAFLFLPDFALAECPPWQVYSHTYYNGCNTTKTIVGDEWTECFGESGGWGTTNAHWRETIASACTNDQQQSFCHEAYVISYTYWENCSGTWVSRSKADFDNANCQCS